MKISEDFRDSLNECIFMCMEIIDCAINSKRENSHTNHMVYKYKLMKFQRSASKFKQESLKCERSNND